MKTEHDNVCREICGELRDTARWLAGGDLSPENFCLLLTQLEARKHQRFGFTLSCAVSETGMAHFTLRLADTGEWCASMDIDPLTGELDVQSACP